MHGGEILRFTNVVLQSLDIFVGFRWPLCPLRHDNKLLRTAVHVQGSHGDLFYAGSVKSHNCRRSQRANNWLNSRVLL